jgi:hypothetical protein
MLRCIIARRRSLYMFVSEHSCVALVNCRKGVCRRRATLRGQALPLAANTFGLSIHAIDKATCYFARSSSSARAMCVGVQRYGQHAHRLCAVYRCRRVRAAIVSFAERNSHGASRTAIPRHRNNCGALGFGGVAGAGVVIAAAKRTGSSPYYTVFRKRAMNRNNSQGGCRTAPQPQEP